MTPADITAAAARVDEAIRDGRIDVDRLLNRIAGEVRLAGVHVVDKAWWVCCVCSDGTHADDTEWIGGLFSTETEAMAEHAYTSQSHVSKLRRLIIRTRPVEVPL